MPYNSEKLLRKLAESNPRVLFYPSSSHSHKSILNLDYDIYIFADKYPRNPRMREDFYSKFKLSDSRLVLYKSTDKCRISRLEEKWVFLYFEDNNKVFKKIQKAGLKLSCFIGVNDGCCEGGNYECVNESKWLEKVFSTLKDGALYFTDHSKTLFPDLFNLNTNRRPPQKPFLFLSKTITPLWIKKAIRLKGSVVGYSVYLPKCAKFLQTNLPYDFRPIAKDLTFVPSLTNYLMAFEVSSR